MTLLLMGGDVARAAPNVPWGWEWAWWSADLLQVVAEGMDGYGYVPMTNNTTGDRGKIVIGSTETLTLDLATTGAGGLHDDHTEAASTGYDVYFCGGSGGAHGGIDIFAVPSGTAITPAKIGDLTGGTWTYWSAPAWFIYNNSASLIQPFWHTGPGEYTFTDGDDTEIRALSAGTATSWTNVDLTGYIPEDFAWVHTFCEAINGDSTLRNCTITQTSLGANFVANFLNLSQGTTSLGGDTHDTKDVWVKGTLLTATRATPATTMYYEWSSTPSLGLWVWVRGAKLRSYAQG